MTASGKSVVAGSVLIAEDDALVREILTRICQEFFADVVVRDNGSEARQLLGTRSFELLITDLRMPGESGLSLLTACRARSPSCSMLLVSGYADEEAVSQARLLGAEVLHKPFGARSLRQAIRRLRPDIGER